jgi:small subunit ribosomal protein S13
MTTYYMGSYKVPAKVPVRLALTKIYGVGYTRAWFLHYRSGGHFYQKMTLTRRVQRKTWLNYFKKRFLLGVLLKNLKRANIKRLKYIKCRRGLRHSAYLPVRGQRTHSNRRNPRYLGSGTWQYVPTKPLAKIKKVSKYIRHKPGLVENSNAVYDKLLGRVFASFSKNKRYLTQMARRGKLGQFAKLAKQKTLTLKKGKKKK